MYRLPSFAATLLIPFLLSAATCHAQQNLDLSETVLVSPVGGTVGKATAFLSDEVHSRTGIRWYIRDHFEVFAGHALLLCWVHINNKHDSGLGKLISDFFRVFAFFLGIFRFFN